MNTAEKTILFVNVGCFLDIHSTPLVRVEWIFLSWFLAAASKLVRFISTLKLRAVASKHDKSERNKLEMTRDEKLERKCGITFFSSASPFGGNRF